MSEERSQAWEQIVAQVIAPLVGLAVTYYIGTHAASIEIELRARWSRLKAARESFEQGRRVAEWLVRAETPKVIEAAERLTRSAAGDSSPAGSGSPPESERGEDA